MDALSEREREIIAKAVWYYVEPDGSYPAAITVNPSITRPLLQKAGIIHTDEGRQEERIVCDGQPRAVKIVTGRLNASRLRELGAELTPLSAVSRLKNSGEETQRGFG